MSKESSGNLSIYYSPCHVNKILGNGGIKEVIKKWEKITGTTMQASLSLRKELVIKP